MLNISVPIASGSLSSDPGKRALQHIRSVVGACAFSMERAEWLASIHSAMLVVSSV
ncbi:hypothetical protein [Flavobacterium sp. WV_118_3]|uniref:hypothetical protein n=1 Tax=Flavobacterium sp. WV_118_3 TaxID=3151764 RepID=UPI003218F969